MRKLNIAAYIPSKFDELWPTYKYNLDLEPVSDPLSRTTFMTILQLTDGCLWERNNILTNGKQIVKTRKDRLHV